MPLEDQQEEEEEEEQSTSSFSAKDKEDDAVVSVITTSMEEFQPLMLDTYLKLFPSVENVEDYSFTGVWHSARALLEFLLSTSSSSSSSTAIPAARMKIGGNILELGAGTGWLGISLAQSLLGNNNNSCYHVVLSDRQGKWLQANLEAAQEQNVVPVNGRVSCVGMDWKHKSSVRKVAKLMSWNWIVGSDLVYSEEGVKDLAGAIRILLEESSSSSSSSSSPTTTISNAATKIIYAHTRGRMPELDQQWESELQANGLAWNILAEIPVMMQENKVWEGRTTLIMDIYQATKCNNNK